MNATATPTPTLGESAKFSLSRFNRRMRKIRYAGAQPTSQKTRQVYQVGILFFGVMSLVTMAMWTFSFSYFVTEPPIIQAALVALPVVLVVAFSWAYIALLVLYRAADQLYAGELDPFPFSFGRFESYLTRAYMDTDDHVFFRTWHGIRANVLLGGFLKLSGVVVIGESRNKEYDKKLLDYYQKHKSIPEVPPKEWMGRLSCLVKIGRRYEVPGAVHIYLLGGHEASAEGFRDWIQRSFPKVNRLTWIVLVTDPLPGAEALEGAQPSAHTTTEAWTIADLDREVAELRAALLKRQKHWQKSADMDVSEPDLIQE